jgi:4-hydroxybutyrate CoA-transferase
MVAINNAMTIDLTGQIASESIGGQFYSGPGGQFEFQLGALSARGGRAITVLPSTTRDGSISKIVAQHPPGEIITVPRQYADYVVTEHGIASLFGKTDRERAAELISIAHPDHRAELRRRAATLFGLRE